VKRWIRGVMNRQWFLWVGLCGAVLVQCSDALPTTNVVQSIELAAMDEMLGAENFYGLVVVMASWCPPCREELPQLANLYRKYHRQGISIIAVSIDAEGPSTVQPLINKLQIPFPVYWVGTKATQHYKIVGIPTILVIQKGVILEKLPGLQPSRIIESKIRKLIS
jgi:thiol-disulfide isomerase/thioredoxin